MTDVDDRVIDWAREDASHDHVTVCQPCGVGLHELCESVACECEHRQATTTEGTSK